MKRSIKKPIPEIFQTWELLCRAVEAHLVDDRPRAEDFFKQADIRAVWEWVTPLSIRPDLNVVIPHPSDDTQPVAKDLRDPDRNIAPPLKAAVLQRDGYRCRYCGIPVVHADIRKLAHRLYPDAVPWDQLDPSKQHAGFACLWMQFDHVVPHSHGGRSSLDNVVISCALCNYGKDKYTLRQLDVIDPRLTPPVSSAWDGLERFRTAAAAKVARPVQSEKRASLYDGDRAKASPVEVVKVTRSQDFQAFFFPAARFSRGYLYTPPIAGKERWFKIDGDVTCTPATRHGVAGYVLLCSPAALRRRGIDARLFVDVGE